jgi:hypothetical protein
VQKNNIIKNINRAKPLIYTFLPTLEISLEALVNLNFLHWPHPIEKIPPVITHAVGAPHQPWNRHQRALKMSPASGGLSTGGGSVTAWHPPSILHQAHERERGSWGSEMRQGQGACIGNCPRKDKKKLRKKKFKLVLCRVNKDIFSKIFLVFIYFFSCIFIRPLRAPNFNKKAPPVNGPSRPNCSFL